MTRLATLALFTCAACGRIGFDGTADGAIGAGDGDGAVDAAPLLPFAPAVELAPISLSTEDDPTLTVDGLEIIFESSRAGGAGAADLYWSMRPSLAQPFGAPVQLATLCTADQDEHPGLSGDGLTLYFATNRPGGEGSYDIWMTTRPSLGSTAWTSPVQVPSLSDAMNNEAPQPTPDDLTLVMASGPNSTDENVAITTRATTNATWPPPALVDAVDVNVMSATDSSPVLSGDQLALYFSSKRLGTHYIYRATRSSPAGRFDAVVRVTELGEASDPWVSPDERTIVFQTNGRLYQAQRP